MIKPSQINWSEWAGSSKCNISFSELMLKTCERRVLCHKIYEPIRYANTGHVTLFYQENEMRWSAYKGYGSRKMWFLDVGKSLHDFVPFTLFNEFFCNHHMK